MGRRHWAAPGAHPEAPRKPCEALRGPPLQFHESSTSPEGTPREASRGPPRHRTQSCSHKASRELDCFSPQKTPRGLKPAPQETSNLPPRNLTTRSQRTLKRPLSHNPGTVADGQRPPGGSRRLSREAPKKPREAPGSPQDVPRGPPGTPEKPQEATPGPSQNHVPGRPSGNMIHEASAPFQIMSPKGLPGTWIVRLSIHPSALEADR